MKHLSISGSHSAAGGSCTVLTILFRRALKLRTNLTPEDTPQLATGPCQCVGLPDMTAIAAGTAAAISMRIGIVNHTSSETMCWR
jgi:hypothetical protein